MSQWYLILLELTEYLGRCAHWSTPPNLECAQTHTHTFPHAFCCSAIQFIWIVFFLKQGTWMKPATWKNLPIQASLNVHLWIAVSCICRQRTAKYIHFSWSRSGQVISIIRGELAIHMVMQCGVNGSCGVKFVSGVEQTAWGHCATAAGQGLSLPHFFFFSQFHFPSFPPFVSLLRKADKCMVKVNVWSHYRALRVCYLFVSLLKLTCRSVNVIFLRPNKM